MKREIAPSISILLLLLITALIVGAVVFLLATRPVPTRIEIAPPRPTSTPLPSPTPMPVTVYVTGAVRNPNIVVTLPYGSRVQDAILAAGGALPNADLERINLAAFVQDGDQIHVFEIPPPSPTAAPSSTASRARATGTPTPETLLPTSNTPQRVHINHATLEELTTLPGIGPALAQRIIDYRERYGLIASLDTLLLIPGIGPAKAAALDGLIIFD